MNSIQLFQVALGLNHPWFVDRISFGNSIKGRSQLHIYISFEKGAKFKDSEGQECPVHDTVNKTWRHLDFFQHMCYMHARVPRIKTSNEKVRLVQVPWARPGSGFTLLFEAFAMCLIENEMPINKAAAIMTIYPNRIWTIFKYWIKRAFAKDDQKNVKNIGIDETSSKKGHNYVTIAADLDQR